MIPELKKAISDFFFFHAEICQMFRRSIAYRVQCCLEHEGEYLGHAK